MVYKQQDITEEVDFWNCSLILNGDSRTMIDKLPDNFYSCCITSPPYWGIRDYGHSKQIGAESTLEEYIHNLKMIFRQLKSKLKEDGTLWLNIGDAYSSGNRTWRDCDKKNPSRGMTYRPATPAGLKPKDLIGIPWRVAFALQQDGWYLRSDIIWHKPNCQPESVKDRPTQSHEYIFLFSKSEKYFYNHEVFREPNARQDGFRNKRTVWSVKTERLLEKHSATFPKELITPMVLGCAKEDSHVLDPFFGSGTVGIVCKENNRNFHGIEINNDYISIAKRRLHEVIECEF